MVVPMPIASASQKQRITQKGSLVEENRGNEVNYGTDNFILS